jgi:outer membrane protein assembly factor BamB
MIRAAAASLVAAWLAAAGPGCGSIPAEHDPFTIADRSELGLPVLSFQWKFQVSHRIREHKPQEFASPVLYGEQVLVGSQHGHLHALSSTSGAVMWSRQVGAMSSQPTIDVLRGRVYVGTDDGSMVCLRASDGKELWRYSTRGPILQPPALADGMILFSNEADQVYALDADTGKFRWQYKGETPEEFTLRGHAGVAVSDGLVFAGFANGTMVALRHSTGSVAWLTSLKGEADRFVDMDGTPVVDGDTVYASSSSGGVYALDKATGLVRWHLTVEAAGPLTVDGSRIYVAAAEHGVYALDRQGHVVWRQGTSGGGEPARPVITGEYLLYALSEEGLFIADKRTGKLHQYFQPGDGVSSTPVVDPALDRLYVMSNRGFLYAMDLNRF